MVVGVDGGAPIPNIKVRQRVKPFGLNVRIVLVDHRIGYIVLGKTTIDWSQIQPLVLVRQEQSVVPVQHQEYTTRRAFVIM